MGDEHGCNTVLEIAVSSKPLILLYEILASSRFELLERLM